jgi:hypothetical protein
VAANTTATSLSVLLLGDSVDRYFVTALADACGAHKVNFLCTGAATPDCESQSRKVGKTYSCGGLAFGTALVFGVAPSPPYHHKALTDHRIVGVPHMQEERLRHIATAWRRWDARGADPTVVVLSSAYWDVLRAVELRTVGKWDGWVRTADEERDLARAAKTRGQQQHGTARGLSRAQRRGPRGRAPASRNGAQGGAGYPVVPAPFLREWRLNASALLRRVRRIWPAARVLWRTSARPAEHVYWRHVVPPLNEAARALCASERVVLLDWARLLEPLDPQEALPYAGLHPHADLSFQFWNVLLNVLRDEYGMSLG